MSDGSSGDSSGADSSGPSGSGGAGPSDSSGGHAGIQTDNGAYAGYAPGSVQPTGYDSSGAPIGFAPGNPVNSPAPNDASGFAASWDAQVTQSFVDAFVSSFPQERVQPTSPDAVGQATPDATAGYALTLTPQERDMTIRTIAAEAAPGDTNYASVGAVIFNRASLQGQTDPLTGMTYPSTVAGVITQPYQFSGYNNANYNGIDPSSARYQQIGSVVDGLLSGAVGDPTLGATAYHANYVNPGWAQAFVARGIQPIQIGGQSFYTSGTVYQGTVANASNVSADVPAPTAPQVGMQMPPGTQPDFPADPTGVNTGTNLFWEVTPSALRAAEAPLPNTTPGTSTETTVQPGPAPGQATPQPGFPESLSSQMAKAGSLFSSVFPQMVKIAGSVAMPRIGFPALTLTGSKPGTYTPATRGAGTPWVFPEGHIGG